MHTKKTIKYKFIFNNLTNKAERKNKSYLFFNIKFLDRDCILRKKQNKIDFARAFLPKK